jgi:hypothetical protein
MGPTCGAPIRFRPLVDYVFASVRVRGGARPWWVSPYRTIAAARRALLPGAPGQPAPAGAVVERSAVVFTAIKYVGAACVVYLGVRHQVRPERAPEHRGRGSIDRSGGDREQHRALAQQRMRRQPGHRQRCPARVSTTGAFRSRMRSRSEGSATRCSALVSGRSVVSASLPNRARECVLCPNRSC